MPQDHKGGLNGTTILLSSLDTLYYAEYKNSGPGAGISGRVQWPGYHVLYNSVQAINFTVAQFIEGNLWLPSTNVKYTSRLGV
ncbi:hypothetical protein V6N13_113230 [Hibiscus sabdariffa]|uniref:Pectinesterase catalytic domain-containing protein n=1 Tax=Hibiscus sabdariffa TaxID=183260 RepID=A0ABR2CU19_9ROSI